MARSFTFADGNPDLLRLYVPRALALITAFPDRAGEFPDPQDIRAVSKGGLAANGDLDLPAHLRADLSEGLLALAESLERALAAEDAPLKTRMETTPSPAVRVA
jgi:hypothetical protein